MQSDRREGGATRRLPIPVVDIFAGAGGLGEGFAACRTGARPAFRVALSIEKDPAACETLELRHFFRAFPADAVPDEYYLCLRGRMTRDELFRRFPRQRAAAQRETWQAALGPDDGFEERLDDRIEQVIGGRRDWVLIGGPPCQAYSIAGRTKNRSKSTYVPEQDRRHFLYEEYLRIISRHWPAVFVMENVKGILTSRLGGVPIFGRILDDLSDPARAFGHRRRQHEDRYRYRLFPLEARGSVSSRDLFGIEMSRAEDFLVRSELHGVPQARHRVFVLGVRDDLPVEPGHIAISGEGEVPASAVLDGLPRLRSGLSGNRDSRDAWRGWLASIPSTRWYAELRELGQDDVRVLIDRTLAKLTVPREDRGAEFVAHSRKISHSARYRQLLDFVRDPRVGGFCNSATREHMPEDLHRYLFAACFARARLCSPKLRDFPESLLPEHQNVLRAMRNDLFADRFRVQLRSAPATTVMSHIAKDGHYFIHPDASQCRSLTVREAARLQTFPDNYAFCGPRTEQYVQVGNAVPPFLAVQIADVVAKLLEAARRGHRRGGAGAGHRGPRTDFPKAARPA